MLLTNEIDAVLDLPWGSWTIPPQPGQVELLAVRVVERWPEVAADEELLRLATSAHVEFWLIYALNFWSVTVQTRSTIEAALDRVGDWRREHPERWLADLRIELERKAI